jgi:tripartite-type tricarboxylate transporter receptor subunit TctC
VARKLEGMVRKAMASKAVTDRLAPQSFQSDTLVGDAFATYITRQLTTYARIVKDANITSD